MPWGCGQQSIDFGSNTRTPTSEGEYPSRSVVNTPLPSGRRGQLLTERRDLQRTIHSFAESVMNSTTFTTVVPLSSLTGFMVVGAATAISAIANMAMFAGMLGGNSDEDGPSPAVAMLLAVVAPIAAGVMQTANFAKLFMTRPPMEDRIARVLGAPLDVRLAR